MGKIYGWEEDLPSKDCIQSSRYWKAVWFIDVDVEQDSARAKSWILLDYF